MMLRHFAVVSLVVFAWGCQAEIPDATYVCTTTADCPPSQGCDEARGLCVRELGCSPRTCEDLRAQCGAIDDGCGTELDCGECAAPDECGGDGVPNLCGCTPTACDAGQCGVTDNGCGALKDCGGCDAPAVCVDAVCVCDAVACEPDECGAKLDGCGGTVDCGGCAPGETCGGGGPNLCGDGPCVPETCADQGRSCDTAVDGCGEVLDCGTCGAPETCGGGEPMEQVEGVCGCTPRTCETTTRNSECGLVTEECRTDIDCGGCLGLEVCSAGLCACPPDEYDSVASNDDQTTPTSIAALGSMTIPGGTIHQDGDDDWYSFRIDGAAGLLTVTLGATSSDLDLRVVQVCGDGSGGELTFGCGPTMALPPPMVGCEAATPGPGPEEVNIRLGCSDGNIFVAVLAAAWSGVCEVYPLSLRLE